MRNPTLIILLTGLTIFGCNSRGPGATKSAPPPPPLVLEGAWTTQQIDDGYYRTTTLKISKESTTFTSQCDFDTQHVAISENLPTSYDDTTFTILKSIKKEDMNAGLTCVLEVREGALSYQIDGESLTLLREGDEPLVLNYVQVAF